MRTLTCMGVPGPEATPAPETTASAQLPLDKPFLRRDLTRFSGAGYDRGRNALWQVAWQLISGLVVVRWWCPPGVRATILRFFGAEIGKNVVIRQRVRIHWPWKLRIGDGTWIGDGAWILNLEPVTIGSDVCISQEVLLCTGSHDRHSPTFEYDNGPIIVEDGAWIAARATVLRGSAVGHDSVIGACTLVAGIIPPGTVMHAPRPSSRPPRTER